MMAADGSSGGSPREPWLAWQRWRPWRPMSTPWCGRTGNRLDGPLGPARDRRPDLRQLDGHARHSRGGRWHAELLAPGIVAALAANVTRGLVGTSPENLVVMADLVVAR